MKDALLCRAPCSGTRVHNSLKCGYWWSAWPQPRSGLCFALKKLPICKIASPPTHSPIPSRPSVCLCTILMLSFYVFARSCTWTKTSWTKHLYYFSTHERASPRPDATPFSDKSHISSLCWWRAAAARKRVLIEGLTPKCYLPTELPTRMYRIW